MIDDPIKGFVTKTIGYLPSEKVTKISFSGAGDIFNIFETEGSKISVSFYMIVKEQSSAQAQAQVVKKGQNQQANKLQSAEEKYDFKKTFKHDIYEHKFDDIWD